MRQTMLILLSIFVLLSATGCGKKGPLYLPDDEPSKQTEQQKLGLTS